VIRLNSADVLLPLHVRTRLDGDRMFVKNMDGSRKIKDIFIDCKVPMNDRNIWPIVLDSAGNIVWLPGLKKSKFDRRIDEECDIILKYY
jgi:tRNA(Ile)-lysidine synthase